MPGPEWDYQIDTDEDDYIIITIIPPQQTLTINNPYATGGTASGHHIRLATSVVSVAAGTRSGFTFIGWTVAPTVPGLSQSDLLQPAVNFTMPTNNVTLTANWEADQQQLTVNNPYAINATQSGTRPTSSHVTINAGTRTGMHVTHWTVDPSDFANEIDQNITTGVTTLTFIMPAHSIIVTTYWEETEDNGNNNVGGGGNNVTPPVPGPTSPPPTPPGQVIPPNVDTPEVPANPEPLPPVAPPIAPPPNALPPNGSPSIGGGGGGESPNITQPTAPGSGDDNNLMVSIPPVGEASNIVSPILPPPAGNNNTLLTMPNLIENVIDEITELPEDTYDNEVDGIPTELGTGTNGSQEIQGSGTSLDTDQPIQNQFLQHLADLGIPLGIIAALDALDNSPFAIPLLILLGALLGLLYYLLRKKRKIYVIDLQNANNSFSFNLPRNRQLHLPSKFINDGYVIQSLFLDKSMTNDTEIKLGEYIPKRNTTLFVEWKTDDQPDIQVAVTEDQNFSSGGGAS